MFYLTVNQNIMIIHTIYTGINKLRFTSVLCCVRFCAPCFVTECSLLVISLFFSPLCLLKLLSKMCVCFPHINLTCFQIKYCFCKIYMSMSEPVTVRHSLCFAKLTSCLPGLRPVSAVNLLIQGQYLHIQS